MSILALVLVLIPFLSFAQWGASYHQSNLPFAGINYQVTNRIRPELRIGTDQYFEELSVEAVVTYDVVKKEDYELYAGLGYRSEAFSGVVVPVGLNVYPFSAKQFGFLIELAPILGEGTLLRGSWGIRYRFPKRK